MPRPRQAASLFAALGDTTRLRLLHQLAEQGPCSITRLSAPAGMSRQAVTRHLQVLSAAGLVRGQRRGREHLWQLRRRRLEQARDYLDRVSRHWDGALERLRDMVET